MSVRVAVLSITTVLWGCGEQCPDPEWPVDGMAYELNWPSLDLVGTVRTEDHQVIVDYQRADGTEWTVVYEVGQRLY